MVVTRADRGSAGIWHRELCNWMEYRPGVAVMLTSLPRLTSPSSSSICLSLSPFLVLVASVCLSWFALFSFSCHHFLPISLHPLPLLSIANFRLPSLFSPFTPSLPSLPSHFPTPTSSSTPPHPPSATPGTAGHHTPTTTRRTIKAHLQVTPPPSPHPPTPPPPPSNTNYRRRPHSPRRE